MTCCCPVQTNDGAVPGAAATSSLLYVTTDALDITNTAAETDVLNYTVPGGSQAPYNDIVLRASVRGSYTNRDNGILHGQTWRVYLGATNWWTGTFNVTGATAYVPHPVRFDVELAIRAQSQQLGSGRWAMTSTATVTSTVGYGQINTTGEGNFNAIGSVDPVLSTGPIAVDMSADAAFRITFQDSVANANLHFVRYLAMLERLASP